MEFLFFAAGYIWGLILKVALALTYAAGFVYGFVTNAWGFVLIAVGLIALLRIAFRKRC